MGVRGLSTVFSKPWEKFLRAITEEEVVISTKFTIATFLTLFALNPCAETLTETATEDAGIQTEVESSEAQTSVGNLDRDEDGKISRQESYGNKNLPGQFDELDADQDGLLDQSEFSRFETAKPGANDQGQMLDEAPEGALEEQIEEAAPE